MNIQFLETSHTVDPDFQQEYTRQIQTSYEEVATLLPFISPHLNVVVHPRTWGLIEGTGGNARAYNSELIEMAFDPEFEQASPEQILADLRPTVFHEGNHAARFERGHLLSSFLENCIQEGLATAFAREHAGYDAPWGKYPDNVDEWVQEIISKNDLFDWHQYSFEHNDGRKWIAYKVGTYIVDQAQTKSGKSIVELTDAPFADILAAAEINTDGYTGIGAL